MTVDTQLEDTLARLDQQLNSHETPLAQRFRALFTLKSLGGPRAIEIIGKGSRRLAKELGRKGKLMGIRSVLQGLMVSRLYLAMSLRTAWARSTTCERSRS
jgi:hypothetical protein